MLDKIIAVAQKDLSLESIPAKDREELLIYITKFVSELLQKDFEKLLSIMYRLDIDENKFKLALSTHRPDHEIAELVVAREEMKVKTREKYRS